MNVNREIIGEISTGEIIYKYTLSNSHISVGIINFGGIITSLTVNDKNKKPTDIVLGFDDINDYFKKHPFFGALVGRTAGRIANGEFEIDETKYSLAKNENGVTHLHGGNEGFDKAVWESEAFETDDSVGVDLTYLSKDGEEGYPGNLEVNVTYELNDNDEFILWYSAKSDKNTPVVMTNHSYFNLNGADSKKNILNNQLKIDADYFLALDEKCIPIEKRKVEKTPMDFRNGMKIGDNINDNFPQIQQTSGYDHPWLLNERSEADVCISVYNPDNGIKMEISTDQQCVVCYTSNKMDGIEGKNGATYNKHHGFCLETQALPDAVNHPDFPSSIVTPETPYEQKTVWKFSSE